MIQVRKKYDLECEETKKKLSAVTGRGDKQPREGNEALKMFEQSLKSLLENENQDCLNYTE